MKRAGWLLALALTACGGGGGGGSSAPPASESVLLSGRITFDRIPFKSTLGQGLDFARPIESPARGVVVEALDRGGALLASTSTDAAGNYSLSVPGNRDLFVRAKAQMLVGGLGASWNFRVLNNTNANALYVLDGQVFNSGTGATRSLHAASGWNGVAYTSVRAAAPFAILDTVYRAKELLLTANASLAMPPLDIFWSASNRPTDPFCPRSGNIVTTAYQVSQSDECAVSSVVAGGIYVLGDFVNGGDTDEFDQSVIAHEFAHYVEAMLGRSDSIGGAHGSNLRLDMRVALSEGFGNAFAAMALNDPIYRDSFNGATSDSNENMEASADPSPGWFSEATVQQVLWDIFDPANEEDDTLALGFTPIFQALIGPQRTTSALTGLHSFVAAIKSVAPAASSAIDQLVVPPPRSITGSDEFATNESNSGGLTIVLPVYKSLAVNQLSTPLCTSAQYGVYNRLGNRQFLRLDLPTALTATITVTGMLSGPGSQAATDPDFVLWRRGQRVVIGDQVSSGSPPTERSAPVSLQAGTYILEIYDYAYANPGAPTNSSTLRCMTVSVTG